MRIETDFRGNIEIPATALYGIHAYRASLNFPDNTRFPVEWYRAVGSVKKSCFLTYRKYAETVIKKFPGKEPANPLINPQIVDALIQASTEVEDGMHFDHFIVPAIQGGAGTSINLNINEIIANRSLILMGSKPGNYDEIDPIEHANIFQSTNDVIPTSLKIALLRLQQDLAASVNRLRTSFEVIEKGCRDHLRIAYTEMQEAVPTTYGRLFSTYNDALSRDWWRISKCNERIKTVNLGGSAIGSGITVPSLFIREVLQTLQQVTGLPVSRAENLYDSTSNLDAFVEVHAILKSHAVNLEKIVSDLRLLSSDLMKNRDMEIPQMQVGSSIMPGKVNPVIAEFIVGAVHKVYSNDQLIAGLCGLGCLELNAYIPVIGHAFIESIRLLLACDHTLNENMIKGIHFDSATATDRLLNNPSIATALVPYVGYHKAALMAAEMKTKKINLYQANELLNTLEADKIKSIVQPDHILREGFSISDIME